MLRKRRSIGLALLAFGIALSLYTLTAQGWASRTPRATIDLHTVEDARARRLYDELPVSEEFSHVTVHGSLTDARGTPFGSTCTHGARAL